MSGKPIDPFWVERIRTIAANDTKRSDASIEMQLKVEAKKLGRSGIPSRRSIARYRREIMAAPESVRLDYRTVRWPETFERGDLPWEAAPFVLKLIHQAPYGHPPVRFARWYWRLSSTDPSLDHATLFGLARRLAISDVVPELHDRFRNEVEEFLFDPASRNCERIQSMALEGLEGLTVLQVDDDAPWDGLEELMWIWQPDLLLRFSLGTTTRSP